MGGRRLQRSGWILAALPALILALSPGAARADVTITVGTGGCTLADALTAAQTGAPKGGCPAGDTAGVTTVALPPGTYDDHDLQITTGRIVLRGHSATDTTIDAQGLGRVFDVGSGVFFAIDDVTLEHGLTSGGTMGATGATGGQGSAGGGGGAILNAGTVTIFDSVLTLNATGGGGTGGTSTGTAKPGGQGGAGGPGGAVDSSGTLMIAGSTFSGNETGGGGTGGTSTDDDGRGRGWGRRRSRRRGRGRRRRGNDLRRVRSPSTPPAPAESVAARSAWAAPGAEAVPEARSPSRTAPRP